MCWTKASNNVTLYFFHFWFGTWYQWKMLLTSGRNMQSAFHQHMLLLYLKGKCYRQEIRNSVKYRATRESSFKSENWLWRTFYFSSTVFLHDVRKPWILPIFWIFLCVCILLWWGGIVKWRHWNFLLAHLLGSRLCHHFEKTAILYSKVARINFYDVKYS